MQWKKDNRSDGYQVQYSTDKKFKKNVKNVVIGKKQTTKQTIKKLKTGKKYYVRIRSYKKISGKKYYGTWSSKKTVKSKKVAYREIQKDIEKMSFLCFKAKSDNGATCKNVI